MKEKIKKLLFEHSENSRLTTKELGKKINTSQQSAFYLLSSLKEKGHILGETTIVDAQKLGYTNVLVGFNYLKLEERAQKIVIDYLKKMPDVVSIEESNEGFDILVEFLILNLAAFDSLHSEITQALENEIKTEFIFPVITKYLSSRKYLYKPKVSKTKILFGGRDYIKLNEHEKKVLNELVTEPSKKIIDIAEDTSLSAKSVTKIKKDLEKRFIIKGYSAILNHKELGIERDIIFIRFSSSGFKMIKDFIEYSKQKDNIIEIVKTIGSSQVVIVVEKIEPTKLIRDLRTKFSISNYMVFRSEKIHKKIYLPV